MGYAYLKPQESGNRWNCYEAQAGTVRVTAEVPFSFKVSPWSTAELMNTKHNYELPESSAVYFHLDYKMSGLGSGSCGPELQKQYRIEDRQIHWEFAVQC